MREKNRLGKIEPFGKVERLRVQKADESTLSAPKPGSGFNDYRDRADCRLKSLEELENFCDSFFNFRRKTVIMNLDFPRFGVGVRPAALWRVASRRVGKPRGKLNKIFYVSSRLDV